MPLFRTKDRDTITLTNFSFADGEVTLIHPKHIPYQLFQHLLCSTDGIQEYLEFCVGEGVTSPEDYILLMEITPPEFTELQGMIAEFVVDDDIDLSPGGDIAPKGLSAADEAILAEFAKTMGLLPDADDPHTPINDEEEDEGDDGLASV